MAEYASKGISGLALGVLGVGTGSNIVVERDLEGRICDVRKGFSPPLHPFDNCLSVPCSLPLKKNVPFSLPLKKESKSNPKEKYEQWKERWDERRGVK